MMKKRYSIFASSVFLIVAAVYFFYPSDENRIRKTIKTSVQAITSEDVQMLMEVVSYNYHDRYGNNYLRLKKTIETVFSRLEDIDIERNIAGILIDKKHAEVKLDVRVIASSSHRTPQSDYDRGYILGDAGEAARITVSLHKPTSTWLITGVEGVDANRAGYE